MTSFSRDSGSVFGARCRVRYVARVDFFSGELPVGWINPPRANRFRSTDGPDLFLRAARRHRAGANRMSFAHAKPSWSSRKKPTRTRQRNACYRIVTALRLIPYRRLLKMRRSAPARASQTISMNDLAVRRMSIFDRLGSPHSHTSSLQRT